MGVTLNSGRGVGIAFAVWLVALAGGMTVGAAQDMGPGAVGSHIEIVGDGGRIRAAGASVTITGTASRVEAAGAQVDIDATVSGPIMAAGAAVTINGSAKGDLKAGGGVVEVNGRFDGRVSLGAAVVRFNGTAARRVEAAAASIEFGPATDIAGRLSAAGANVVVAGKIGGPVHLGGASITFNGSATGNVTLDGGRVTVGPAAVIGGNLVVRSLTAPVIAEGATVTGKTIIQKPSLWWVLPRWMWKGVFAVIMAAGTVLAGIILIWATRGTFEDGLAHATFRPLSSGLIGIVTLIVLPVIAALLMATIIGFSFGLALLLLIPFLLVAGHTVAATCIGVWIFDRTGEPRNAGRLFLYLLAGAIVMALVWMIPWAGPIIVWLAILVGTGAWFRSLWSRLRRRSAAVA